MNIDDMREEFKQYDGPEEMFSYGRLTDVDPEKGSATLVGFVNQDHRTPVRFDDTMKEDVIKLKHKFVKVRGQGWCDGDDDWIIIVVEGLEYPVFNNPNRKPFNWSDLPRARVPFTEEESKEFDELLYRLRHPGAP